MKNNLTYRITILERCSERDDDCITLLSRLENNQREIIDYGGRHTLMKIFLSNIFTKVCSIIKKNHVGENVVIEILDLSDKIVYQEFVNDLDWMGLEKTLDFYEKTWGENNDQRI
tara:strand:+ start:41 stop:385 length:345 start_codon:yes stop_codon:yes gene_type:complete